MTDLNGIRILIMSADGFEQSELVHPRDDMRARGAKVDVASPDGKSIRGWDGNDWGDTVEVDMGIGDTSMHDYDALILPGGQINPDILRTQPEAVLRVQEFVSADKPVAAICHGPWMLVEANAVESRQVTSYPSIRTDLRNAGAIVVDDAAVTDGPLITSRNPDDLPAFCDALAAAIMARRTSRAA
ncbi:type 1 glutamine amidotransferase [Rhodobacteraceae bacterium CCMM004]|nr:type 1 glutamine amidotransferase [Rhodobacteraceae bacterium CCMM004]